MPNKTCVVCKERPRENGLSLCAKCNALLNIDKQLLTQPAITKRGFHLFRAANGKYSFRDQNDKIILPLNDQPLVRKRVWCKLRIHSYCSLIGSAEVCTNCGSVRVAESCAQAEFYARYNVGYINLIELNHLQAQGTFRR